MRYPEASGLVRMGFLRPREPHAREVPVPAGSVEDGETPLEGAERELAEEVGGRVHDWRHQTTFYSSRAHLSLRSDAFLATGVSLGTPQPWEDEDVVTVLLPVEEALARARSGSIFEGQTALALSFRHRNLRPKALTSLAAAEEVPHVLGGRSGPPPAPSW